MSPRPRPPVAVTAPAPAGFDLDEATVSGDPDLDLIDAAFDTGPLPPRQGAHGAPPPPAAPPEPEAPLPDYGALDGPEAAGTPEPALEEPATLTFTPLPAPDEASAAANASADGLQREVARLQAALEDAQARSFSADVRIHQLEAELAGRATTEEESGPEGPRATSCSAGTATFSASRQTSTRREQELADLREQAMHLEQQNLELTGGGRPARRAD